MSKALARNNIKAMCLMISIADTIQKKETMTT